jgi:hypothetical protein
MPTIKLDSLLDWECHNISIDAQGRLRTRWGFQELSTPTSGTEFIWGFSETLSGVVYHYLFERNTTTGILTIRVVNENLVPVASVVLPAVPQTQIFSRAVVEGFLIISGPGFNTLFGSVGSGLILAESVPSLNSATTALDIPTGLSCSFGNRSVVAQGNILYFSDPSAIRTYVAQNALSLGGHIYNLVEISSGLLIGTTDGVYILPKDSLSQGQEVFGALQKISTFSSNQYRSLVNTPRGPVGINKGIYFLSSSSAGDVLVPLDLHTYYSRRLDSPRVDQISLQFSQAFSNPAGLSLAVDGFVLDINLTSTSRPIVSWISHDSSDLNLVGILSPGGGNHPLYCFRDRICWMRDGISEDFSDAPVTSYICGTIPGLTEEVAVTSVITTSNNDGEDHQVYLRGQESTITNVLGNDVLDFNTASDGDLYSEIEVKSCRHRFRVRTIEPQMEISITGAGSLIGTVSVDYNSPVGSRRGQNR